MNQKIKFNKINISKIVGVILIAVLLFLALQWLTPLLTSLKTKGLVEKLGIFGPFLIISYIVLSHVLAPVAGTPGVLLGSAVFGVGQTLFFIYLSGLISAIINFWISRKFGRQFAIKLTGKKTMRQIDNFVDASGTKLLVVSRIFGFALFEIISYAAGLTKINFTRYFLITAIFSAIPATIFGLAFKKVNLRSGSTLFFWLGAIIITGAIFAFFVKKYIASRPRIK